MVEKHPREFLSVIRPHAASWRYAGSQPWIIRLVGNWPLFLADDISHLKLPPMWKTCPNEPGNQARDGPCWALPASAWVAWSQTLILIASCFLPAWTTRIFPSY